MRFQGWNPRTLFRAKQPSESRSSATKPSVAVVVPISDETAFLPLTGPTSVTRQRGVKVELWLAPYGKSRAGVNQARAWQTTHPEAQVLPRQRHLTAALRHAVSRLTSPYFIVLGPQDELLPGALVNLAESLATSGSQVAIGGAAPRRGLYAPVFHPVHPAHQHQLVGTSVTQDPILLADHELSGRLIRTAWWRSRKTSVVLAADLATELTLAATQIDVLTESCFRPGELAGASGIWDRGEPPHPVSVLVRRWRTWHQRLAEPRFASAWLVGALLGSGRDLIERIDQIDDAAWNELRAAARDLLPSDDRQWRQDSWLELDSFTKIAIGLVQRDQRALLAEFVAEHWAARGNFTTQQREGHVVRPAPSADLPESATTLSLGETPLAVHLQAIEPGGDADTAVELTASLFVPHVHLDHPPTVTAALVSGAERIPLNTAPFSLGRARHLALLPAHREQDYRPGQMHVSITTKQVDQIAASKQPWHFEFTWQYEGLIRSGGVNKVDRAGTAAQVLQPQLTPLGMPEQVSFVPDPVHNVMVIPGSAQLTSRPKRRSDRLTWQIDKVAVGEGEVRFTGNWSQASESGLLYRLTNGTESILGEERLLPEHGAEVTFALAQDSWDFSAIPLPLGRWRLVVHRANGDELRVKWSRVGAAQLGSSVTRGAYRVKLGQSKRTPELALRLPLAEAERGSYAQAQLRKAWQVPNRRIDTHLVYFQCYSGMAASDSQLALSQHLARTRPDLHLVWAVADPSVRTPFGVERAIVGSQRWYDVLHSAKYLCANTEFDRWFQPHPEQVYLQTFHGYPAKSMGVDMWRARHFSPRMVDAEVARTGQLWDLIVTPCPEMDEHYREQYRYTGPIAHYGYPRNDGLVGEQARLDREETRKRLGIEPDQIAVLYAPTWRETASTNYKAADFVSHFDLNQAAALLGPEYVFLVRGHRFHKQTVDPEVAQGQVREVTNYPEINHLISAADAAVMDYSSLRFDFALTGKPTVFLVPDLAEYTQDLRGFLFSFRESAPGPLLTTTREVATALADLPGLNNQIAGQLAEFNARFNYLHDGQASARVAQAWLAR